MTKISYCGELVRKHDPDRFLLSLFVQSEKREALWALFAFNHEIAKTREVVTEPTLGQIRLQWWRDALAGIYERDHILQHEVVQPLAEAIKTHELARALFEELIDARAYDLEERPPANMEELLIYADHTSTPLLKLALLICGDDPEIDVVQPVAMNYALLGIIRSIPYRGKALLPADLIEKSTIKDVAREVANQAVSGLKPESRFLGLCDTFSFIYLKKLKNIGLDPESPRFSLPPAFLELRLAIQNYRLKA